MTWPFNSEPRHGQLIPRSHGVPLPREFYFDFGVPEPPFCVEQLPEVFSRKWARASVELDCASFLLRLFTRLSKRHKLETKIQMETTLSSHHLFTKIYLSQEHISTAIHFVDWELIARRDPLPFLHL
jgi:hypothetical protein